MNISVDYPILKCFRCGRMWVRPVDFFCINCGAEQQALVLEWGTEFEDRCQLKHVDGRFVSDREIWAYADDNQVRATLRISRGESRGAQLVATELVDAGGWEFEVLSNLSSSEFSFEIRREVRGEIDEWGRECPLRLRVADVELIILIRVFSAPSCHVFPQRDESMSSLCQGSGEQLKIVFESPLEEQETARFQVSPGDCRVLVNQASLSIDSHTIGDLLKHPQGRTLSLDDAEFEISFPGLGAGDEEVILSAHKSLEVAIRRNSRISADSPFAGTLALGLGHGLSHLEVKATIEQERRYAAEFRRGGMSVPQIELEEVVRGAQVIETLNLLNAGSESIDPLEFQCSSDWISVRAAEGRMPAQLKPEAAIPVDILLDTNGASLPMEGGDADVSVCVQGRPVGRIRISVGKLVKPKRVRSYLGIDFGTSNTTVAFQTAKSRRPRCLEIRSEDVSDVYKTQYPSAIAILKISGTPKVDEGPDTLESREVDYVTGNLAMYEERNSPGSTCLSRAIKRRLGGDPIPVWDKDGARHRVEPKELVSWLLSDIVVAAQSAASSDAEEAIEFARVAYTYPAGFSARQRSELEEALKAAFGSGVRVERTADEATIGAIGWVNDELESLLPDGTDRMDADVLVFDCGGGTTDISVVRISLERLFNKGIKMIPQCMGVTGLPRFGGEDVTRAVAELVVEKIEFAARRQKDAAWDLEINWSDERSKKGDGVAPRSVAQTRSCLLSFAEEVKVQYLLNDTDRRNGQAANEVVPFVEDHSSAAFGEGLSEESETFERSADEAELDEVWGDSDDAEDEGFLIDSGGIIRVDHEGVHVPVAHARLAGLSIKYRRFQRGGGSIDEPWNLGELGGAENQDYQEFVKSATITISVDEVLGRIRDRVRDAVYRAFGLVESIRLSGRVQGEIGGESGAAGIHRVLLTGQSSAIPIVKELFIEVFGEDIEDRLLFDAQRAKSVVAEGAVSIAARKRPRADDPIDTSLLIDACQYPIGIADYDRNGQTKFKTWIWNGTPIRPGEFQPELDQEFTLEDVLDEEVVLYQNLAYRGLDGATPIPDDVKETEDILSEFAVISTDEAAVDGYLACDGADDMDRLQLAMDKHDARNVELFAYVAPVLVRLTPDEIRKIPEGGVGEHVVGTDKVSVLRLTCEFS